jgi:succinate-acetate transporter protein
MAIAQQATEKSVVSISPGANPAPLGLMGFGATTVLLNLHNAGIITGTSLGMIFAMGLFYGGVAQVIAGLLEFRKNNTFGTLAFTSYGLFWISLVALLLFPKMGLAEPVDNVSMAFYLGVWGLFTAYMFVGTLKKNRVLQVVFGTLTLLFFHLPSAITPGSLRSRHSPATKEYSAACPQYTSPVPRC